MLVERLGRNGMSGAHARPSVSKGLAEIVRNGVPKLRWIQFYSTGYNNAETFGLPSGVTSTNAGSVCAPPVAEHAMTLLPALVRQIPHMERGMLHKH